MNSVTTQCRRSQLTARPMPDKKGPAQLAYGVMVSGCFEPVCYQFADWIIGDFNGQAGKVECEHSVNGSKTATVSQSRLSGGNQKLNGLYTCATDTSISASVLSNSFNVNSGKQRDRMGLLMTSRLIIINSDLAYNIGLSEAIALQQTNYWLQETKSGMESGGVRRVHNTTEQWLEQPPFWPESVLKYIFTCLKILGVLKIEQLNESRRDMTNFYTANYESEFLDEVKVTESKRSKYTVPPGQNDTTEEVKVTRSIRPKRADVIRSKYTDDLVENTTESTTGTIGKDSCLVTV